MKTEAPNLRASLHAALVIFLYSGAHSRRASEPERSAMKSRA